MKYIPDLARFDDYNRRQLENPVYEGGTLLYGSSFFTNWGFKRAHDALWEASNGRLNVTNHGFGGATADELLYYYHDLVKPVKPEMIVWRGGANDYFWGIDVHDAWQISMRSFEWAKKDFPGIKIAILCVFEHPSAVKEDQRIYYKAYDALAREYAADNDNVYFLDINDFFHKDKAQIGSFSDFRDVFGPDGLHMHDEGYAEFARYIAPRLTDILVK